jgi:hypothetical protein
MATDHPPPLEDTVAAEVALIQASPQTMEALGICHVEVNLALERVRSILAEEGEGQQSYGGNAAPLLAIVMGLMTPKPNLEVALLLVMAGSRIREDIAARTA